MSRSASHTHDAAEPGADLDSLLDDVAVDIGAELRESPPRSTPPADEDEADDEDFDPDEDEDEDSEDDGDDEEEDDDADDEDSDDPDDDADDEDDDEEEDDDEDDLRRQLEELRRREDARKLAEARAEEERKARARDAAWTRRWNEGQQWFSTKYAQLDRAEAQVYEQAQRAVNPTEFIRQNMARINAERKQVEQNHREWDAKYHQNFYKDQTSVLLDLSVRSFVAEARAEYQLTVSETATLYEFARKYPDPELAARELERILSARRSTKKARKSAAAKERQKAAREIAKKTPRPGQGRRSQRPPKNLEEYVDRLDIPLM